MLAVLLFGCPDSQVPLRQWAPGSRIGFGGLRAGDQFLVQRMIDTTQRTDVELAHTEDGQLRLAPLREDDPFYLDERCTLEGTERAGAAIARLVPQQTTCELPTGIPTVTLRALGEPRDGGLYLARPDGGCEAWKSGVTVRRVLPGSAPPSEWVTVSLERLDFPNELTTWWATAADGTTFAARLTWRGHSVWAGAEFADGLHRLYTADSIVSPTHFASASCDGVVATSTGSCRPLVATFTGVIDCAPSPRAVLLSTEVDTLWNKEGALCTATPVSRGGAYRVVAGPTTFLPKLPAFSRGSARLSVHWLEVPDAGSTSMMTNEFFDSQTGRACSPMRSISGRLLCVPSDQAAVTHFGDSICRTAIATAPASSCRAPAFAVVRQGDAVSGARRVLGVHTKAVFEPSGNGCTAVPLDPALSYFTLDSLVPAEEAFAEVSEVTP